MRRRPTASIVANPVLVGAVTTLVVVVAVFLAYNANNGLPFVPTSQYVVEASNGANLVRGNEVREGGFRIGVIEAMEPAQLSDGTTGARLELKLDKKVGELPEDTTFRIRPRSALGLKYVELSRGKSEKMLTDGDTIKVSQSSVPVELDEFYNMFDEPTRRAAQGNLQAFGDTFAVRGPDLNRAIESLPGFARYLEDVARLLADPDTQLTRFFKEIADAARIVAPVGKQQAKLFTDMADTFAALSADEQALKDTISRQVPLYESGTVALREQRPFLRDFAAVSRSIRLSARELRPALPTLNRAVAVGTPVLRRSVTLNEDLQKAMAALDELVSAPQTGGAVRGLSDTVNTLHPLVKYVGPYQTVCNYWNNFWTLAAEHVGEVDTTGTAQRALINFAPQQLDSPGSQHAARPANGEQVIEGNPAFVHGQVYGAAIDDKGNADCETGQRGFPKRLLAFGAPDLNVVGDPYTPGNQGPTFLNQDERRTKKFGERAVGRTRVPKGQTFSRRPITGPQMNEKFHEVGK